MNELDRYSRQILVPEIDTAGQEQLLSSSAAVVGCEALGVDKFGEEYLDYRAKTAF